MQPPAIPDWEGPIPEEWRLPVLQILQGGKFGREIVVPTGVRDRWDADTLGTTILIDEVRYPLITALSAKGLIGMLEPRINEPGVAYAFWFYHQVGTANKKFYGKICLMDNKVKIKLLSAHLPIKGDERL